MTILVIAEHDNATLKPATLHTLGAAARIGGEVHVLVAGQGVQAVAQAASQAAGVAKVLVADSGPYKDQLAENLAGLLVYAQLFVEFPLPDDVEPPPVFRL